MCYYSTNDQSTEPLITLHVHVHVHLHLMQMNFIIPDLISRKEIFRYSLYDTPDIHVTHTECNMPSFSVYSVILTVLC